MAKKTRKRPTKVDLFAVFCRILKELDPLTPRERTRTLQALVTFYQPKKVLRG